MRNYICLKILGESANGYLGLFKDGKEQVRLSGNIPLIPNGSSIFLDVEDGFINDYDFPFTTRNCTLLGDECDAFRKKVKVHKIVRPVFWNDIDLTNPYSFESFEKADNVYRILGGKAEDRMRLDGLFEAVRDAFRSRRKDTYTLDEYVNGTRDIEEQGAFGYLDKECLVAELNGRFFCLSPDCKYVKDKELVRANQFIMDFMSIADGGQYRFKNEKTLADFCYDHSELSDEQKEAVMTLTDYSPVVITGYAGTGKTTVIKSLIEASGLADEDILLLAPTGRARERITESTGKIAKTIHSALRKTPKDDFTYYNEHRKLPQKLIIIDESSMIDTLLMYDLLKAISPTSKIYFCGDFHQLKPVACGEPFHTFISQNVCKVVRLTKIYRQDKGLILQNSQHILNGEGLENGDDFIIRKIHKEEIPDYVSRETQVISPYNELNDYVNEIIQARNDTPFIDGTKLKIGDSVMGTVNTEDYCNGDIGTVTSATEKNVTISFNGHAVSVSKRDIKNGNIVLAYAITVHKMQGSECDRIKIFLPVRQTSFIDTALLYTAVTRARKKVGLYYYE